MVGVEAAEQSDPGEHLEAVKLDKLVHFAVEVLLIFAFDEPGREDLGDKLGQEAGYVSVARLSFVEFLENSASVSASFGCLLKMGLLLVLPVGG